MAMDDLFTALNMFKQGAQQLGVQRAVDGANQQVQQIKASELNDQQQRAALQGLSNQLTMHLAGMGVDASKTAQVSGAINGPQMNNANDMYKQGLLTGNNSLMKEGTQLQNFDNNKDFQLAKIQAKTGMNQYFKQKADEEKVDNQFRNMGKDLDETAASSRSAFGAMGMTGNRSDRIQALLGDPNQYQNLTSQDAILVGEGLGNLVKNGVLTEPEIKGMFPNFAGKTAADLQTYVSGNPAALHAPGLFQKFQDIKDKEERENNVQASDTILKRATDNLRLNGEDSNQFKTTVAASLQKFMPGVKPEDVTISGGKVTVPEIQEMDKQTTKATGYLKQAYAGLQSNDPNVRSQAASAFSKMNIDPNRMKLNDAVRALSRRIRRGQM